MTPMPGILPTAIGIVAVVPLVTATIVVFIAERRRHA